MDFEFQSIAYDRTTFLEQVLPGIPKTTAVYRIFDVRGQLIVLDKTSNLAHRLERYFGAHSEPVKDLDLRQITGRIEFTRTYSPFETAYVLYLERRSRFPKSYRRMKTFRYFTLMKFNLRQRFPRVYASRQIKPGVEYFGPFGSRAQFTRVKTAIERTFKLRPCLFNIRGNDPHPDCIYFQMHTCSRPCNNDIDRNRYLTDVRNAMAFVAGDDDAIRKPWLEEMTALAAEMKFEEAEAIRRKLERVERAGHEASLKGKFRALQQFNFVILLPAGSAAQMKVACVRSGGIAVFREYETETFRQSLVEDLERCFNAPAPQTNREWLYDEFCLVSTFLEKRLKTVLFVPWQGTAETLAEIEKRRANG